MSTSRKIQCSFKLQISNSKLKNIFAAKNPCWLGVGCWMLCKSDYGQINSWMSNKIEKAINQSILFHLMSHLFSFARYFNCFAISCCYLPFLLLCQVISINSAKLDTKNVHVVFLYSHCYINWWLSYTPWLN